MKKNWYQILHISSPPNPIPFRHNFGVIVCGYISDYHHLSAPVILIAPVVPYLGKHDGA